MQNASITASLTAQAPSYAYNGPCGGNFNEIKFSNTVGVGIETDDGAFTAQEVVHTDAALRKLDASIDAAIEAQILVQFPNLAREMRLVK